MNIRITLFQGSFGDTITIPNYRSPESIMKKLYEKMILDQIINSLV